MLRLLKRLFLRSDPEPLRLQREGLRLDRSQIRWARIGAALSVLFGLPGLLTFVAAQSSDKPSVPDPLRLLSDRLSSLKSGVGERSFLSALGEPIRKRDISQDFELGEGQEVWETLWLVGGKKAWVQVLTDEDSTVWFFSVVSCDDRLSPTFRPTTTSTSLSLRRTPLSAIAPAGDVYAAYLAGADWPGYIFEAVPGGSRATSFREAMWGVYPACGYPESESIFDEPVPDRIATAAVLGELEGTVTDLTVMYPELSVARSEVRPNLFGEFALDFIKSDSGIPVLRDHLEGVGRNETGAVGPLFGSLDFLIGPDFILTENLMN